MNPNALENPTDPAARVETAVAQCLDLAATWIGWNSQPVVSEDGDRIYTPGKVVRRIADHLIDHLAETEALLSGAPTVPDQWSASLVTTDADWARFTEVDLREARERLTRIGQTYALRLRSLDVAELDAPRKDHWTLREIAIHVADASIWYANQLGRLGRPAAAETGRALSA